MPLGSIIYTVFANDSDTGNASKVSYSIEEVSTVNCRAGHAPDPALSCARGAEGAGGPGQGQPHGSGGAGTRVRTGGVALHPLGNGCEGLNCSKLGMSQVVGDPYGP